MQNKFVIDDSSKSTFANKTLLLDTNALIDAYRLPEAFVELLEELIGIGCDITTTKSIVVEFLGGTKDKDDMGKKTDLLELIFGKKLDNKFYLPIDRDPPNPDEILQFSRQANKFGIVDFELYRTIKKYNQNIVLISRNHKDFTKKICDRVSFITLLGNIEIHTYGVYKYR